MSDAKNIYDQWKVRRYYTSQPSNVDEDDSAREVYAKHLRSKIKEKYNTIASASEDLSHRVNARYLDESGNFKEQYRADSEKWKADADNAWLSAKSSFNEMEDLLKKYKKYDQSGFSYEMREKLKSVDSYLGSVANYANEEFNYYSQFKTEEDYNKHIREKGYYKKHSGKSYDEIQKEYQNAAADPERAEEASWLKYYGVNYGYEDEDYYNAAIAALQPKADAEYFEDAKRASEYAADSPAGYVGHLIGTAISNKIKDDPDSAKTQYEQIQAARTRYEQENVFELQYADLQKNEDFASASQNRAFANPTAEDFEEWYNRQNGGLTSHYDENGNWYSVDVYGDVLDENYEANHKPQIADKLGLYLAASDEDKERVLSSMSLDTDLYLQYLNEGRLGDWDNLKPEEIGTYYYLMNTEGQESAYKFLDNMKTELNHRTVEAEQAQIASAEGLELAFYNAVSVPANVFGGVFGAVDDAVNVLQGKRINPYSTAHSMTNFSSAVREETAKDIAEATEGVELFGQNIPAFLYQTTMSVADSALGAATLGGGYTVFMGMTSASNEAKRLYELGADNGQIVAGSVMAGAAEAIFEKVSIDRLLSPKDIGNFGDLVIDVLKQAGVEASEETFTELANTLTNSLVMAGNSDLNNAIAQYEQEGMTKEEAIKQAWIDKAVDVGYAAFGGALSGAGMGSAVSGANYATRNVRTGAAINETEGAGDLVAQTVMDNRDGYGNKLYALAQKVANSENKSGHRYDRAVGKLYNQAENALIKNGDASGTKGLIKDRLVELGLSENDAKTAASGLFKSFVGRETNRAETKLFRNNSAVQQVWKELNDPANTSEAQTRTKEEQLMAAFNPNSALNAKVTRAYEAPTQTELYRNASERFNTAQQSLRGAALGDAETASRFARKKAAETATVKETEKDVSINTEKLIASIDGDQVQIHTADGVKNIDDVELSDDIKTIIDKGLRNGMDADEINAMVAAYDGSEYGEIYAAGYTETFNRARMGDTKSAAMDASVEDFGIRRSVANQAYTQGLARRNSAIEKTSDRKAEAVRIEKSANKGKIRVRKGEVRGEENVRKSYQPMVDFARMLAEKTGVDIVFYNGKAPRYADKNGVYRHRRQDGVTEIWLNADTGGADVLMRSTMAHELTHMMEVEAPREYEILKNFLMDEIGKKKFNALVEEKVNRGEKRETAISEVVAELCEDMLDDGSAIKRLAETDLTTFQKIKEWIDAFLRDLLAAFDSGKGRHHQLLEGAKVDLERMQQLFNDGLAAAVEQYNAGLNRKIDTDQAVTRYSSNDAHNSTIKQQLRDHLNEVNAHGSVADIQCSIMTAKEAERKANDEFKRIGYHVDRQGFGIIEIGEKQIKKAFDYLRTSGEYAALMAVPKVLKRGLSISEHTDHKERNYPTVTIAAQVNINSNPVDIAVVVRKTGKNKYYTHRVLMPDGSEFVFENKKDTEPTPAGVSTTMGIQRSAISSVSNNKVPQNGTVVNSDSMQFDEKYSSMATEEKTFVFSKNAVETALYDSLYLEDLGHNNLIKVSSMPRYISDLFGINGDFYIYRNHAYENIVTEAEAKEDNRYSKRAHYHGLGIETMAEAMLSIENPLVTIVGKTKDGNPIAEMVLPVFDKNGAPLYAVLSFYANREINGSWETKPHVLLTISNRDLISTGKSGYRSTVESVDDAIENGRIVDIGEKNRADLSVIAQHTRLGNITRSTLNNNLSQFLKEIKEFREKNKISYSTEILSKREILSEAFLQMAETPEERAQIAAYQEAVQKYDECDAQLQKIKAEIKEKAFSKGPRDQKVINELIAEKERLERQLDRWDGKLFKLDKAAPLRAVFDRARARASKKARADGREAMRKSRENRKKTVLRNRIKKNINELNHLLTHGTKKKNVKAELQETVASALALGDLLFNDEISNEDIVRAGVLSVTERESKLLNEYMDLLEKRDKMQKGIQSMLDHPNPKYKDDLLARESDLEKLKARISRLNGQLSEVFERERNRYNRTRINEVIDELANAYGKLKGKEETGDDGGKKNKKERPAHITAAYSQYAYDRLVALKNSLDGTIVKDMSLPQLQEVSDAFTMVRTLLRKADELFQNGRSVEDAGRAVMREVQRFKKERKTLPGMVENAWMRGNQFGWRNMKPIYAFDRIGSETLKELYWALIEGEGVYYKDIDHAKKFIQAKKKQYHYTDWNLKRAKPFKLQNGETIKLNILQMMSIHAYAKREQAHAHMFEGGFMFVEGETYKEQGEWFEKNQSTAKKYKMDPEALMEIERALTEDQKAYADEMQQYLSEVMGAKGNEVSRQLYGIDLFKEENYFPLKSQTDFVSSVQEALQKTQTHLSLRNAGMTKETVPGANNPIILRSFEDVWIDHVAQMSQYHAMVLPIDNLARIFNYQDEGGSVKNIIHDVFGKHAENYIDQYLLDLNGGVVGGKERGGTSGDMIGKFKKAQVAASLSTAIQQPTAVLRAMAMIDPHYFVAFLNSDQAKTEKGLKNIYDEMLEYAPIAGIKEMGGFDIGSSNQAKRYLGITEREGFAEVMKGLIKDGDYRSAKMDDLAMSLATLGDKIGWASIWGAVKREIAAKGVYTVGSKEFFEACGKRFTEIIVYTQVYDSVNSRSEAMRSEKIFDRMLTAFMGEPTTSMNMMANAFLQWTRAPAGQRAAATAQFARTIGFTLASTFLAEAAASFIYGLRDDDDEDKWEAWMKRLGRDVFSFQEMAFLLPKMLPGVRDLISILQGFQVERSDLTLFAEVVEAYKALWKKDISTYRKIEDFGGAIAACFGLPLRNVMRELRGLYNLAVDILDQSISTPTASTFELGSAAENRQQISVMLEAGTEASLKNLEKKIAEGYRAPMSDSEKMAEAQKTARSNLKANFTRYYKEEYFSAFQASNGKRMKEIAQILAATGLYESVDETLKNWRKEWYIIN